MAGKIQSQELRKLLGVAQKRQEIKINAERLWIYQYQADQRLPQVKPNARAAKRGGLTGDESLVLPVGPVDKSIIDGHHYVVTEVLSDLPLPPFPNSTGGHSSRSTLVRCCTSEP